VHIFCSSQFVDVDCLMGYYRFVKGAGNHGPIRFPSRMASLAHTRATNRTFAERAAAWFGRWGARASPPVVRTVYRSRSPSIRAPVRGIAVDSNGAPASSHFVSAVGSQVGLPVEVSPDLDVLEVPPVLVPYSGRCLNRVSSSPRSVHSVSSSAEVQEVPDTGSRITRSPSVAEVVPAAFQSSNVLFFSLMASFAATAGPSPPASPSSCECGTE